MIHFREHLPNYFTGFELKEYDCETLEELLEKNKNDLTENQGFVFAYGDSYNDGDQVLMVSSTDHREWWVLGWVTGIDLSKELPHYDKTFEQTKDSAQ